MSEEHRAEFEKMMVRLTSNSLWKWYDLIITVEDDQEKVSQMMLKYAQKAEECFSAMYEEAAEERENVCQAIEKAIRKAVNLAKQLGVNAETIDIQGHREHPVLRQELALLLDKISGLEEQASSLHEKIKTLKDREHHVCKALDRPPRNDNEDGQCLLKYIEEFEVYLSQLELKLFEREDKFYNLKPSIQNLAKSLHFKSSLDFERMIIFDSDHAFVFSDQNMENLEKFYKSLKEADEKITEELRVIREQLHDLWSILEEDRAKCELFLQTNQGNNYDVLKIFQKELNRCLELKKANIEIFAKQKRLELISLWNACRVDDLERNTFYYLNSDAYSEDLLALFEIEISKWKNYFEKNGAIFKLLDDRQELRSTMMKLEERAANTDRYRNRGGKLLEEEKERNRVVKQIPKIEAKLKQHSEMYYQSTGKHFLVWGQRLDELMNSENNNFKEQQRQKLDARKVQREKMSTLGKSTFGLSLAPSLQNLATTSAVKRKLETPVFSSSKRPKRVARTAPTKICVNNRTVMRYSTEKLRRIRNIRKSMEKQEEPPLSGYQDFEKFVEPSGRSTLMQDSASSSEHSPMAVFLPPTPKRTLKSTSQNRGATPAKFKTSAREKLTRLQKENVYRF